MFNALFDIIYSFFDTDLSVMCLSVIGDFYRRSRYETIAYVIQTTTLKTSKMNDIIILVKRDKLTPNGDHRLQKFNAG